MNKHIAAALEARARVAALLGITLHSTRAMSARSRVTVLIG